MQPAKQENERPLTLLEACGVWVKSVLLCSSGPVSESQLKKIAPLTGFNQIHLLMTLENLGPFGTGELVYVKQNDEWYLELSAPDPSHRPYSDRAGEKAVQVAGNEDVQLVLFRNPKGGFILRLFEFRRQDLVLAEISVKTAKALGEALRSPLLLDDPSRN